MGSACEGAVQMCENKTSPNLTIRDTDVIYLLGSRVSGEVFFFLLLVVVVVAQWSIKFRVQSDLS